MGSGRSKSCLGSSAMAREASDVAQPPPSSSSGGGRRRRSKSLFCGLHSSCLASSSTSHYSDDDNDEQVCNGWMRKSHGSVTRRRMESRIPVIDNVVRDIDAMRFGEDGSLRSPRVVNGMDSTYAGLLDRRHVVREPSIERNVRFSRTLSVGRLRDRVLRRSSLSDFAFRPSPHQGEEDTDLFSAETAAAEDAPVTSTSILNRSASSIRRTLFGIIGTTLITVL